MSSRNPRGDPPIHPDMFELPPVARGLGVPPSPVAKKTESLESAPEATGSVSRGTLARHEGATPAEALAAMEATPEKRWTVPSRQAQLERLKNQRAPFDVLVIGGGATGAGATLEAARRGLDVACVEAGDFASGTSSRSTKLIHGGVRYLEQAVKELDFALLDLVREGLHERKAFLEMAPHLSDELRILTPLYKRHEVPYLAVGLKLYDLIAGRSNLSGSTIVSKKTIRERYPAVKTEGLRGGVEYSDGEFNDSRMNVALATTAAAQGAAVANHVEVTGLVKTDGRVKGVHVRDRLTGETWTIRAKVVVNATGPFIDGIRKMDDPTSPELVVPSAGTHIVVDRALDLPEQHGLLIPKAPNGSVAFIKPFEGGVLIGTTEEATALTEHPHTTEEQVEYLLDLANQYLEPNRQLTREDVASVWTGIRPLVRDPKDADKDTKSLSRDHIVDTSPSGLVTIGGGKWTTFAKMGRDVIDAAVSAAGLEGAEPREPARVIGAHGYRSDLPELLEAHYLLPPDVARHLALNYGDRATDVLRSVTGLDSQGQRRRLHPAHPYLEAEVHYAVRNEYAQTVVDVVARRMRLAFVDAAATDDVVPRVATLMGRELGWSPAQVQREVERARDTLAAERPRTSPGAERVAS